MKNNLYILFALLPKVEKTVCSKKINANMIAQDLIE